MNDTLVFERDVDLENERIRLVTSRTNISVLSERSNGKQHRRTRESEFERKCKRQDEDTAIQMRSEEDTKNQECEVHESEEDVDSAVEDEDDDDEAQPVAESEELTDSDARDDDAENDDEDARACWSSDPENDSDIENTVSSDEEDDGSVVNVAKRNAGRSSIKKSTRSTKDRSLAFAKISSETVENGCSKEQKLLVSCDKTGLGIELNVPVAISANRPYSRRIRSNEVENAMVSNEENNLLRRNWIGCRLKLLNLREKFHPEAYLPECLSEPKFNVPRNRLINLREEVSLVYDVDHEEIKTNERHPVLAQQATLLRTLCLFNGFDARDVRGIFST